MRALKNAPNFSQHICTRCGHWGMPKAATWSVKLQTYSKGECAKCGRKTLPSVPMGALFIEVFKLIEALNNRIYELEAWQEDQMK